MRKKPSMFSKDYRRKLKLRRIKYMTILVFLIIIIVLGGTLISSNKGFSYIRSLFSQNDSEKEINMPVENENEEKIIEEEPNITTFEAILKSGKKIVINYEEIDGKRKFSIIENESEVQCNLSPSQERVLILDRTAQDMYLVNLDEELVNITNSQYVATTNEIFKKDDVLNYNPSYKWIESAQFIDDTHIAYTSGLPWINDTGDRYLWIFNLEDGKHTGYFNIKGKEVTFGQITNVGIAVSVDGKQFTVDKDGKIVQ
ncbi:hypothetical protein [Clostridium sp.]|uniref:hypothetical protein n=1 Tax=Clostridium sp. TaxID=1506 RepID=UPI00321691D2